MPRLALFAISASLTLASGAHAQASSHEGAIGGSIPVYFTPKPRMVVERNYFSELQALRSAAVTQQARDGGSLAPASRAALQRRLDALNADYRRQLRNIDPRSVSGMGEPR